MLSAWQGAAEGIKRTIAGLPFGAPNREMARRGRRRFRLLHRSVNIEEIPCRGGHGMHTESELTAEFQRARDTARTLGA